MNKILIMEMLKKATGTTIEYEERLCPKDKYPRVFITQIGDKKYFRNDQKWANQKLEELAEEYIKEAE